MLPVRDVRRPIAYWSRYQAARCDRLQQNCLMNILVLAQKYDNEAARRRKTLQFLLQRLFYFILHVRTP